MHEMHSKLDKFIQEHNVMSISESLQFCKTLWFLLEKKNRLLQNRVNVLKITLVKY